MSSRLRLAIQRSIPLLVVWAMFLGGLVRAQVADTFYNDTLYTASGTLNATNFVNDSGGTFSVTPATGLGWLGDLYQQWHYVRNFTNNGEMDCITGFRFDTKTAGDAEAKTFFNSGNINCGTNSFFAEIVTSGGGQFQPLSGFGGIQIWATNVYNSGTIKIGPNGLVHVYGHNIDFTRGTVTMPNILPITGTGRVGQNTNDWFPSAALTPTNATTPPISPPFFTAFGQLFSQATLPNTTPYFDVKGDGTGTNFVVRAVFVQNDITNTPYNVYFTNAFANGFATVEWTGSYLDPATAQTKTHYLYLTDDYVQGGSTNILSFQSPGIPNNYSIFVTNSKQALGAPQASNFPSIFGPNQPFPSGEDVNSNIYSSVDALLVASTVSTNSTFTFNITNLPGRVEIVASNELNLSLSRMSGMNYLMLRSTNNYDNDGHSLIQSPYSDVYLGRTNGTLVISNLLVAALPDFNGSVQAWTTRWLYTDPTTTNNYDFRVLLVEGALYPTSQSQQQDFDLYSSNNITISDTLNIYRSFYINCTNLVLTTNAPGSGASSFQGELNMLTPNITWAASTPRLRNLTNNGAIRTLTQARFGTPALPYFAFINTGTVSNGAGTVITAGDVEQSGYVSSGSGSFIVNSTFTTMTNGSITADGAFTNNCGYFVVSNTKILIGKSFSIIATNLLTDGGTTNNFWSLGLTYGGFGGYVPGLALPIKPLAGDILGTTITNTVVAGTLMSNLWSATDYGAVNAGFNNNAAIGQLVLDAQGPSPETGFYFSGTATNGMTNAMYVDNLQLHEFASYTNRMGTNILELAFNTNLVIYYAQAMTDDGTSIAEKLNHFNNDHLRWVPTYAGKFSSVTLIYPDGSTNTVNAALAGSSDIDSNGNGIPNASDPAPIFTPSQLNFVITMTNLPPKSARIQWTTVANGTNYVYYKTNLLSPTWMPFTTFNNYYYGAGQSKTNAAHTNWFPSPMPYPSPPTNVWIFDGITNMQHYYRVVVQPWLTYPN